MRDTATFPTSSQEAVTEENHFWTWPRAISASVLLLLVIALGVASYLYANWNNSGKIAPGLIVQGESLGGLSRDEAEARLQKRFGRLFINLQTPDRVIRLSASQLGAQILIPEVTKSAYWYGRSESFPVNAWKYWTSQKSEQRRTLPIKWDKDQLRRTMWAVATNYKQDAHNARLEVTADGVQVVAEQEGRALNVGQTCADLQKKYFAGKPDIEATTTTVIPRLVAADLSGQDVLLGQYTTYFNPGEEGRTVNVGLAADAVNGKVLMPNEKFSFNAMTGERTMDKGYRVAHIFIHKPGKEKAEVVDGRGGGVCQVSTTLYNAVRKTNDKTNDHLRILERNSHSLPVSYAPSGLDATVAWPHKDFQFRNTFAHPVYLKTEMSGSKLKISVWGRVPEDVQSVTAKSSESENAQATNTQDVDPAQSPA